MSFFHIFVHTDGHGEGFFGADKVSASVDSPNAACSKDVVIVPEKGVTARIFIPSAAIKTNQKLPLLLSRRRFIHGLTILFHVPQLCRLSFSQSKCYCSLSWLQISPWTLGRCSLWRLGLLSNGLLLILRSVLMVMKLGKTLVLILLVFLRGNSAGGNIVHSMAFQASFDDLNGIKLSGIYLVQPYFGRNYGVVDNCWVICMSIYKWVQWCENKTSCWLWAKKPEVPQGSCLCYWEGQLERRDCLIMRLWKLWVGWRNWDCGDTRRGSRVLFVQSRFWRGCALDG